MQHRTALLASLASLASLGLVCAAASTGSAADGGAAARHPQQPAPVARLATVTSCNGAQALSLNTRISQDAYSFDGTSGAQVQVPGAQVLVKGPKKGKDTFLVTFSAESYYSGTGWMGVEVEKDGVPIPHSGGDFAFSSEAAYHSDSAQFCTTIGKGLHTLTVSASTTGGAGESGWLDDWTMSVQRFD